MRLGRQSEELLIKLLQFGGMRTRPGYAVTAECVMMIAALVAAFLVVPWMSALSVAQAEPEEVSDIEIAASVDFDGAMFTITNRDYSDWTNVELCVNYGLPNVYRATVPWIRRGSSYPVGAREFTKRYGTRFDPFRTEVLQFSIWCDTRHGRGVWREPWQ